ncbi:MAG: sigma 54-interacting transcriptional regulator [Planctomycetota bacterium]|nr:sigma 54-interacting transcriptional regulator [Planctomycetota bacterium]
MSPELTVLTRLADLAARPAGLDEVLRALHGGLPGVVPCDRIALAFLHPESGQLIWGPVCSACPVKLATGHRERLAPDLRRLLDRNEARILDDLPAHAARRPRSALALLLAEGMHSNLALPLRTPERPLGMLWLSSHTKKAYRRDHAVFARLIADRLAVMLDRARLASRLQSGGRALAETRERRGQLADENRSLREALLPAHAEPVGESPLWLRTLAKVERVAPSDATVLLRGETGTGKELLARRIHRQSGRRDRPFVAVNVAALPSELASSELFGHEQGAFTGAHARRIGRVELARGGTLFLDEVGELSADVQVKLLRLLQEREFERVGGSETLRADVRIVAATNRDLEASRTEGTLRDDLFFRLNVFPIRVPPLRERKEDVESLLGHFLEKHAARAGRSFDEIEAETFRRAVDYPWPGNVRELENLVERHVLLCDGPVFSMDPGWDADAPAAAVPRVGLPLKDLVRDHILRTLRHARGKIYGEDGAAALLGLNPSTLQARLKVLGIDRKAT